MGGSLVASTVDSINGEVDIWWDMVWLVGSCWRMRLVYLQRCYGKPETIRLSMAYFGFVGCRPTVELGDGGHGCGGMLNVRLYFQAFPTGKKFTPRSD